MSRIEKTIDKATWNRKEHFEHFSAFSDPFFGVTAHVDCTNIYHYAKKTGLSFSLLLLHRIVTAACGVEEFRYRKEGDEVVCYDSLVAEATVARADHTFSFASFEYDADEVVFVREAKAEIERLQQTTGLNKGGVFHPDAIHYSAVPWFAFTDMKHPANMNSDDSVPKISTGRFFHDGDRLMIPVSVTCHHGLMDGYHVGCFLKALGETGDCPA